MTCVFIDVGQRGLDVEGFKFGADGAKRIFSIFELFGGVGKGQDDGLPFDPVLG